MIRLLEKYANALARTPEGCPVDMYEHIDAVRRFAYSIFMSLMELNDTEIE